MTNDEILDYCRQKEEACICQPFGKIPVCAKINNHIFCEIYPDKDNCKITLRCEPTLAVFLNDKYFGDIVKGYHCPITHQKYKITVFANRSVSDEEIYKLVDNSYENAKMMK